MSSVQNFNLSILILYIAIILGAELIASYWNAILLILTNKKYCLTLFKYIKTKKFINFPHLTKITHICYFYIYYIILICVIVYFNLNCCTPQSIKHRADSLYKLQRILVTLFTNVNVENKPLINITIIKMAII
jgi:hypothetical protein